MSHLRLRRALVKEFVQPASSSPSPSVRTEAKSKRAASPVLVSSRVVSYLHCGCFWPRVNSGCRGQPAARTMVNSRSFTHAFIDSNSDPYTPLSNELHSPGRHPRSARACRSFSSQPRIALDPGPYQLGALSCEPAMTCLLWFHHDTIAVVRQCGSVPGSGDEAPPARGDTAPGPGLLGREPPPDRKTCEALLVATGARPPVASDNSLLVKKIVLRRS